MATKYYCDRCGKELDGKFMRIDEQNIQYFKDDFALSHYRFTDKEDKMHVLCTECYEDYLDFLNGTFIDI